MVRCQPSLEQVVDGDPVGWRRGGAAGGQQTDPGGGGVVLRAVHGDREVPGPPGARVDVGGDADLPRPGTAFALGAVPTPAPTLAKRTRDGQRRGIRT